MKYSIGWKEIKKHSNKQQEIDWIMVILLFLLIGFWISLVWVHNDECFPKWLKDFWEII